jgi:hypothetical protein
MSSASKYTDIPEDCKPLDNVVSRLDSKDSSSDDLIMTTMPPTKARGDSHNQTQCLTRHATKLKVLNQPGFPQPVPKPAHLNYVVKQTDKMGKGVFATRDIKFGELIFAERPLLVVPANFNVSGIDPNSVHYSMEQHKHMIMAEWEKKLNIVVEERMTEEDRKAFKELQNSHTEDGSPPILGVVRTNGFGILGNFDTDHFSMGSSYTAVGKITSRVNHRYLFFQLVSLLMRLTFCVQLYAQCSMYFFVSLVLVTVHSRQRYQSRRTALLLLHRTNSICTRSSKGTRSLWICM